MKWQQLMNVLIILMSNPSDELNKELQHIIADSIPGIRKLNKPENPDEEEDRLISKDPHQETPPTEVKVGAEKDQVEAEVEKDPIIDPFHELTKNNDVVPLLAVLNRLDLTTVVEGKPLLSRLCTMHVPLPHILASRQIVFTKDEDNRTALHDAIAADDVPAAYWCFQHNVGNYRDNFGNSPIQEAIRLGRRACFLLCLHYEYLDSEAAHCCAVYNRAWELKVLHKLGIDVLWSRDSQHLTPLERAVENYSYDAAEYLTKLSGEFSMTDLAGRTDSKGILRLVKRIKKQNSVTFSSIIPLACIGINILLTYLSSTLAALQLYQSEITLCLGFLTVLYFCLSAFSWTSAPGAAPVRPDFLALLKAPEFPPSVDLCPECLVPQDPSKQHCFKCKTCVQKFHYHQFVCVHKKNEVFWLMTELVWFWLIYNMHGLLYDSLKIGNLKLMAFSSNFFFGNAAVIDELFSSEDYPTLGVFLYLKIFMIYQFFCVFQWLYMLVLNRTYQEANHSERYVRLYRIGKTHDGSYKSQEIRLMQKGFLKGSLMGLKNLLLYFFR